MLKKNTINMQLWKHQNYIVNDLSPDNYCLWHETGSGKTITLIELAKKKGGRALIVCPKSIVDQWREQDIPEDWEVISKENFKKKVATLTGFDIIIIDEAHFFSNYKSQMTKALLGFVKNFKPKHIYLATATPYMSSSWNIYTYLLLFGKAPQWNSWKQKFFYDFKMGPRIIPVEKKKVDNVQIAEVLKSYLSKIGNFVSLEDTHDVPEQIFQKETFELTKEQKDAIANIPDITPIIRWTKIHQICGGTLKDEKNLFLKNQKIDRLKELAKEHKKLVVVCRYNNEVDMIANELSPKKTLTITGKTKDKNEVVKLANELDDVVVVVNASCAEGYELPKFRMMVFYSYDFSLKNYIQMKGRILRANYLRSNVYLSLVVKGTIDEDVYKKVVQEKSDFQIELYDK